MAATYEPIASQTLGSDAASVTFSTIPATYTDLRLVVHGRTDRTVDSFEALLIEINSDTGSNYSYTRLLATNVSVLSERQANGTALVAGRINPSADGNTSPGIVTVDFLSYSNINVFKTVLGTSANSAENTGNVRTVSLWRSTNAVSQIVMKPALATNFKANSTFSLYGIKAA